MNTFDLDRFLSSDLPPRQAAVPVPDLAAWFPDGTEPVWTVRALTGEEIARSSESSARYKLVAASIQALTAAGHSDNSEAMARLIGYGPEVPDDLAKRLDYLTVASVTPAISRPVAVKLFAAYPVVAYQLTNKILELTGQGPELGKEMHSIPAPTC